MGTGTFIINEWGRLLNEPPLEQVVLLLIMVIIPLDRFKFDRNASPLLINIVSSTYNIEILVLRLLQLEQQTHLLQLEKENL